MDGIFVCRCGRTKKYGNWYRVVMPFSDVIKIMMENLLFRFPVQDKFHINLYLDKCDECQRKGVKYDDAAEV